MGNEPLSRGLPTKVRPPFPPNPYHPPLPQSFSPFHRLPPLPSSSRASQLTMHISPPSAGPVRASSNPPNNHLSSPFAWTPSGQNRNHHGVTMVVRAAAEATEQAKTTEFQFGLAGGRRIDVAVTQCDDGAQEISFWSDVPGRLILHWGVVGGPNYQGGWRLPPESLWPEGTVNYKAR